MNIRKIRVLYFSATGNTERAALTIAEELAKRLDVPMEKTSFTCPAEREREYSFTENELVLVAAPTYAGKLPNKILPDFRTRIHGHETPAVPVVLFGNRSYDNSLAELCAVLEENGFYSVAAGAFVGQHAFTNELAYGRPGWSDQFEMREFAKKIADKIKSLTGRPAPLQIPGDAAAPYYVPKGKDGEPVNFLKAKPKTNLTRCNRCGACARFCPMGAIAEDMISVPGTCIKCHRCVQKCTKQAKYFDDPAFLSHVAMLEQCFADSKENEVFL